MSVAIGANFGVASATAVDRILSADDTSAGFGQEVDMLSASSTLVVLIALLSLPASESQPVFHPPTECGPISAIPAPAADHPPEVQARATDLTIWALFFHHPIARQEVKIVWRVTGTGAFHVRGYQPLGATTLPTRGPAEHLGSTWDKPGDEWGTWFAFPSAGCWDLHVTRGDSSGDLWIDVK